jgi:Fe-S-cluster-containing hydrogenase component 2
MLAKHGWRLDRFAHNYLYFRFYYPYVRTIHLALPALPHLGRLRRVIAPVGRMVFDRYHSKVLATSDARKILTLDRDLLATSPRNRQVIPFRYAHKILLTAGASIAVMDCPCKRSAGAPAEDLTSCIAVGNDLSAFWLEHCDKYHARRITADEALALIARMRARGHVTQAFFKVATGGSTGVICNCHPDSCVSLIATRLARRLDPALSMNAASGYSVERAAERCTECRTCGEACPFAAIARDADDWRYDRATCLGCGLCVERCPEGALSLVLDPAKPRPLDVDFVRRELADGADPTPPRPGSCPPPSSARARRPPPPPGRARPARRPAATPRRPSR